MSSYPDDAIAIVGVGCVTPGAGNLDEFWRVLVNGENHVIDIPPERWNVDAYYSPDTTSPGKSYVRRAGLIKAPDEWDNRLFNINDFEADQTDPQQRLVLDCTHMALENAGITRAQLQGSNTGVYVGAMNSDYRGLFTAASTNVGNYTATGISNSIIAARVSYVFDLRGPSMTIDTACSSALVSVHLGAQAIKAGDCDMALCGGTNYLTLPDVFVHLSKAHMLSPTGQCHAFSDAADGYTRGEGCGMIVLKRLRDAERDGDNIWATVVTGSNQDGRTVSPMSAPSMTQQIKLMEHIYANPQIEIDRVDYVEAHGTGTPAGDPIEANAVGNFFKDNSTVSRTRYIGTVKTNMGHLESAAGAAGIIKVLLMMRHSQIVPSLHFANNNPNPRINFEELQLQVPTEVIDWPTENKIACASSFGFGGTNSHAVLIEYCKPKNESSDLQLLGKKHCIVCFSANSDKSLNGTIREFIKHEDVQTMDLHDISYTSTCRRDHYNLRMAKVVDDIQDLIHMLEDHINTGAKAANALRKPRVVFVFCGMGTNWKGMCKEMMMEFPLFRGKLEEIDKLLSSYVQWSLVRRLEDESDPDDPEFSPISIFACQVALACAWQSIGIQPQCIVGQSVGEVAAAHIAGCLSLEDAVKVIYYRTHHLAKVTGGKMIIVRNIQEDTVKEILKSHEGKASIALHYSPRACAISGDSDNIAAIKKTLLNSSRSANKQVQVLDLQVPVAYHSHHVESCKGPLAESLQDLDPMEPTIDIISTVTGEPIVEAPDVDYWVGNMRNPVLFHQAISKSWESKQKNVFIEIGPKPVLRAHLGDIFPRDDPRCIPSMSKSPEYKLFLNAVADMYELGADLEWKSLPTRGTNVTAVPKYCFNPQKSLALSEAGVTILSGIASTYRKHQYVFPLEKQFGLIAMVSPHGQTSLYDHVVSGVIVVPGAFYVEVGLGIAAHLSVAKLKWAVSVDFEQPLVIQRDSIFKIDVEFTKGLPNHEKAKAPIKLVKDGKVLATLRLTPLGPEQAALTPVMNLAHIQGRCKTRINKEEIYTSLRRFGFQYGEGFSLITTALKGETECLATMRVPAFLKDELTGTFIHPSILDAMLQSAVILMSDQNEVNDLLPRGVNWFVVHRQVEDVMLIHTTLKQAGRKQTIYDITLLNTHGIVIAELEGLVIRSITEGRVGLDDMYNCDWKEIKDIPSVYSVDPSEGEDIVFITDVVPATPKMLALEWQKNDSSSDSSSEKEKAAITEKETEKADASEKELPAAPETKEIIIQYSVNDNMYNNLPKGIEEETKRSKEIKAIAVLCLTPFDDTDVADTMQEQITNVCFLIRGVLMRAAEQGHTAPVFICTNKAWPSPVSKTSAHKVNPLMTAIWGMTRCALREQVYPKLITVEVQAPEGHLTIGFLQRALSIITDEKALEDYPEFLVTPSGIYVNQLVQVESEALLPSYRNLHADADKSALLLCQDSSYSTKPFAIYHDSKPATSSKEMEYVTIKAEAFAMSHPELFSMSVQYSQMAENAGSKERGCPVFAMEVVGDCPQDPDGKTVCFYPVAVCTQITVPKYATIKANTIPDYQVGDLTRLIVMWLLHQQVQSHRITILTSNRTKHLSGLLEGLLTNRKIDKKKPIVSTVNVEDVDTDSTFLDTVVSLVFLDGKVVSSLAKRWEGGKSLVTVSGLLSSEGQSALSFFLPKVEVQVINTTHIFHPRNLNVIVPSLRKWMKRLNGVISKIADALHSGFPANIPPGIMIPPGGALPEVMTRRQWASAVAVLDPRSMKKRPKEAADLNQLLSAEKKTLEDISVHAGAEELFRADSIYVVVGGLTGLGWLCVKYLAEQGAGYVAIVNRRSPTMEQEGKIEQVCQSTNCQIQCFQADSTSLQSVQALFKNMDLAFSGARVKGIFYGAAIIEDSILLNMDPTKFKKVLSPKVKGIWNFHLATENLDLDYFVMHSSITSVVGNGGQTHYGAGNAFMDGVAHYRQSLGLAAQSINWGALDIGILETNTGAKQMLEAQGFVLLTPKDIKEILTPILMLDWPQIMPSKFDREKMAARIQRDMLVYLEKRLATLMPQNMSSMRIDNQILQRVQNARNLDPEQRIEIYEMYITALACQVLSIDQSMVTPDANLIDLGMDSISAMTMIGQIARDTQVRLPAILFVSGEPSPQSIAQAISDGVDGKLDVPEDGEQTLKIEEIEDEDDKSTPVSPIEAHQLNWYKRTQRKQSMHGTVDIPIPPAHANLASVRAAIFTVLAKHPQMRAVFNERHNNPKAKFKRAILNPDEIFDLRVIEDSNGISERLQEISEETFDTEKAGPIRFIFTPKPTPMLRLVLHKVGFDLKSMSVLVQDLIDNLEKTHVPESTGELVPIVEEKHEEINKMNQELEKLYKEKADDFYRFWEQLGHREYAVTTLGQEDVKSRDAPGNGMVCLYLRPALVHKLKFFIQQHRICLFTIVTTCYQLLLHALTGKKTIPVIFPLDLRHYFDDLRNEVGNFCNEIPLITDFNCPQKPLQEFIIANNKNIQSYIDHGILPFSMFNDMADRILHLFNTTPHYVSVDHLSNSQSIHRHSAVTLPNNGIETHLLIQHDMRNDLVCLTLTYNNTVLNRRKAHMVLKCASRLINKAVSRPTMTVGRAETQCKKLRKKLRKQLSH
nr:hypothetical protein BaRGS_001654 [Batillaria attramentaria]